MSTLLQRTLDRAHTGAGRISPFPSMCAVLFSTESLTRSCAIGFILPLRQALGQEALANSLAGTSAGEALHHRGGSLRVPRKFRPVVGGAIELDCQELSSKSPLGHSNALQVFDESISPHASRTGMRIEKSRHFRLGDSMRCSARQRGPKVTTYVPREDRCSWIALM